MILIMKYKNNIKLTKKKNINIYLKYIIIIIIYMQFINDKIYKL